MFYEHDGKFCICPAPPSLFKPLIDVPAEHIVVVAEEPSDDPVTPDEVRLALDPNLILI